MSYMDRTQFRKVAPAKVEQRGEMRHPVIVECQSAKVADSMHAHLVDLSSYGCRIEIDNTVDEGTRLRLVIGEDREISATTVWCEKGQVGCRFEEAIDISLFRSLTINS